jgi:hypothetical protein
MTTNLQEKIERDKIERNKELCQTDSVYKFFQEGIEFHKKSAEEKLRCYSEYERERVFFLTEIGFKNVAGKIEDRTMTKKDYDYYFRHAQSYSPEFYEKIVSISNKLPKKLSNVFNWVWSIK